MRRTARNAVREKTHGTQPSGRASLHRTSRLPIPVSRAHTPAEMQAGTAERAGTVARAGRGGGGLAESGWPRGRRSESGEPGWNMYALCRHGRGPVPLPLPPDRFFFQKKLSELFGNTHLAALFSAGVSNVRGEAPPCVRRR